MTRRKDDMVIRPDLGLRKSGPARERAKEERRIAGAKKQGGTLRRLAMARQANKIRRNRTKGSARAKDQAIRKKGARPRLGVRGGPRLTGMGMAAKVAARTPWGLIISAAATGIVAATRLVSGRSLENMGAQVNKMVWGDADEDAKASMMTRQQMSQDPVLSGIAGMDPENRVNDQMKTLFDELKKIRKREVAGQQLFEEDKHFQNNSFLDAMILTMGGKLRDHWTKNEGKDALDKLEKAYKSGRFTPPGGLYGWR